MKKFTVVLIAGLLYCFLAYSQESDSALIIPRVDVNTRGSVSPTLYSLFEGDLGESFSYSVCNHWLSSDPGSLYSNTFRSDDVNWLDWAYLCWSAGSIDVTLGKDMIAMGTFEIDAYDFDSHSDFSSTLWNNLPCYQWAAKVGYTFPDESTYLAFQASTSPFGEQPFKSGLYSWSLYDSGEYGCYSNIWSANLLGVDKGEYISVIALGNKFTFGDFEMALDFSFRGLPGDNPFKDEIGAVSAFTYHLGEKFDFTLKGGYECCKASDDVMGYYDEEAGSYFVPTSLLDSDYKFGGFSVNWYPLRDSHDLRIHALVVKNSHFKQVTATLGATYFINLTNLFSKNK